MKVRTLGLIIAAGVTVSCVLGCGTSDAPTLTVTSPLAVAEELARQGPPEDARSFERLPWIGTARHDREASNDAFDVYRGPSSSLFSASELRVPRAPESSTATSIIVELREDGGFSFDRLRERVGGAWTLLSSSPHGPPEEVHQMTTHWGMLRIATDNEGRAHTILAERRTSRP